MVLAPSLQAPDMGSKDSSIEINDSLSAPSMAIRSVGQQDLSPLISTANVASCLLNKASLGKLSDGPIVGPCDRKNTGNQISYTLANSGSPQETKSVLPISGRHLRGELATHHTSTQNPTPSGCNTTTAARWGRNSNDSRLVSRTASQYDQSSDTDKSGVPTASSDLWKPSSSASHKTPKTTLSEANPVSPLIGDTLSVDVTKANAGVAIVGSHLPSKPTPSATIGPSSSDATLTNRQPISGSPANGSTRDGPPRAADVNQAPLYGDRVSTGRTVGMPASGPSIAFSTNGFAAAAAPTIDPRILDQAVRAVLNERFGVNSLTQLPPLQVQSLLSGPLPQLIASYLQSWQGSPTRAPLTSASATTADTQRIDISTSEDQSERLSATSPGRPQAPPIALLPASPAPFPADALPSEIQIEQNTNLYLNGLGDYVTDDELLRIGSQFGEVISHKAIINSETGLCKGYGFIMFAWAKDAAVAMVELQKRGYQTSFARHESFSAKLRMMSDARSTNVYVSNLPLTMTDQQLEQLVAPHAIVSRRILTKADGTSRGVGFIRFHSREVAQECIDRLHGKRLIGHPHPLQARFADSENQKRLKQDTSLRKVYADLDMGVLANHPASTSTRRSMSQTSVGSLARPADRAVSSTGMTVGRSDPGTLRASVQTAGLGGVPMISPTSSLAGFYPGPIGAGVPPSPLWAAATMGHHNQSSVASPNQNVWSPEVPPFHLASSPITTPGAVAVPPYWSQKATGVTDNSVQQGGGTPSLSPSGSASTLNSPAFSLDVLGQGLSTTAVSNASFGLSQLNTAKAVPFNTSLPSNWALSPSAGTDIERQMKGLSISPSHQNLFTLEQNPAVSSGQHSLPSSNTPRLAPAAVGQGINALNPGYQSPLSLLGSRLEITGQISGPTTHQVSVSADVRALDSLGLKENALQSSNFVRASAQKTVIPIVNPETGKAWAISNASAPSEVSQEHYHEEDGTANNVAVSASSSAPVVTVSTSGDVSTGNQTSFEASTEQADQSAAITSSCSAPALLATADQEALS